MAAMVQVNISKHIFLKCSFIFMMNVLKFALFNLNVLD